MGTITIPNSQHHLSLNNSTWPFTFVSTPLKSFVSYLSFTLGSNRHIARLVFFVYSIDCFIVWGCWLVFWLGGDWDVFCLVGPSLLVRSTIQQDHSKVFSRIRIGFQMRSISVSSVPARRFRRSHPHFNFYATFAGSTLLLRNNHTGYSNTEVIYSVAGSISHW